MVAHHSPPRHCVPPLLDEAGSLNFTATGISMVGPLLHEEGWRDSDGVVED